MEAPLIKFSSDVIDSPWIDRPWFSERVNFTDSRGLDDSKGGLLYFNKYVAVFMDVIGVSIEVKDNKGKIFDLSKKSIKRYVEEHSGEGIDLNSLDDGQLIGKLNKVLKKIPALSEVFSVVQPGPEHKEKADIERDVAAVAAAEKEAAVKIQGMVRIRNAKKVKNELKELRAAKEAAAAVKVKGKAVAKEAAEVAAEKASAVKIQRAFRAYKVKKKLRAAKEAAVAAGKAEAELKELKLADQITTAIATGKAVAEEAKFGYMRPRMPLELLSMAFSSLFTAKKNK